MLRVTLDTNILVSATFWKGDSFKILEMVMQKKIDCVLSYEIIMEYMHVLESDEITEKTRNISNIPLSKILTSAIIVNPLKHIKIVKDPDDNKIIECAIEGKCPYIITNDNHLLILKEYDGIKIVSAKEFLEIES